MNGFFPPFCSDMISDESSLTLVPFYGMIDYGANYATSLTSSHAVKVLLPVEAARLSPGH